LLAFTDDTILLDKIVNTLTKNVEILLLVSKETGTEISRDKRVTKKYYNYLKL